MLLHVFAFVSTTESFWPKNYRSNVFQLSLNVTYIHCGIESDLPKTNSLKHEAKAASLVFIKIQFDRKPPTLLYIYTLSWCADLYGKHEEIIGERRIKVTLVTHTQDNQYTLQEPQAGVLQAVVSSWLLVTYKSPPLLSVSLLLIDF